MTPEKLKRIFEIIPGWISWSILVFFIILFIFRPIAAAVLMIIFLLYWVCRLLYMSILLVLAHHRVATQRNKDWSKMCETAVSDLNFKDILHVVLYTIYKEPRQVLEGSLCSLKDIRYPRDRIIVVLAGEERQKDSLPLLTELKNRFTGYFKDILVTIHPQDLEGEIPAKGANAAYAAKKVKDYLAIRGEDPSRVVISCFDADTCVDKNYFACLTYNFASSIESMGS